MGGEYNRDCCNVLHTYNIRTVRFQSTELLASSIKNSCYVKQTQPHERERRSIYEKNSTQFHFFCLSGIGSISFSIYLALLLLLLLLLL